MARLEKKIAMLLHFKKLVIFCEIGCVIYLAAHMALTSHVTLHCLRC
jgi:hypothetical protein